MRNTTPLIPWLLVLASCSSPPKPPTVDESQKRPVNSQMAVELQVCRNDLQNTRLLATESGRLAETTAATLANVAVRPRSDGMLSMSFDVCRHVDTETDRQSPLAREVLLHAILEKNAQSVTAYLNAQIAAGAQAVMVFDTWGGLLPADAYRRFSLGPMRDVLAALAARPGPRVPTIVFTKGGGAWLPEIAASGADGVGLDWTVDIAAARAAVGGRVALQGNLDPLVLLTDPDTVRREASAIVRAAGPAPGHIFNLGHGIVPGTPPENVAALVEAVHATSRTVRLAAAAS